MCVAANRLEGSVSFIKTLALLAALGMASSAQAVTTLLSDTFGDNARTDGPGLYDTDWYTTNSAGTNLTVATNIMTLAGATANYAFTGAFASDVSQTVAIGYALELSFSFNFVTTPTSNVAGLRFGLYNSDGALETADNTGLGIDDDNDGYLGYASTGGAVGSDVRKETGQNPAGTDNSPLMGTLADLDGATAAVTAPASFGTSTHTAGLRLTRTGSSSMLLELIVDSVVLYSVTDTGASGNFLTFNEVAIGRGAPTQSLNVDNIQVLYTAVPEPGSLSILGLGGLALLRRRRA
jgi:hypothetical protein